MGLILVARILFQALLPIPTTHRRDTSLIQVQYLPDFFYFFSFISQHQYTQTAADVFVFPSFHENLPIALLEAGKMGLPCIASCVGGIPEVVRDGETGFLIKDNSACSYKEMMEILMKDVPLRNKMGLRMREDIENRFSMSLMCERIKRVYADVQCGKSFEN